MAEKSPGLRGGAGSGLVGVSPSAQPLSRELIENAQRRRIVVPLAELAHERVLAKVTVAEVVARAKMGRVSFYRLFGDRGGCLRFAFKEAHHELFAPVQAAYEVDKAWPDRVANAIDAFFDAVVARPLLAEFSLLHSLTAEEEAGKYGFEAAVKVISEVMNGGRAAGQLARGSEYVEPAPLIEECLARGVVAIASMRIRQNQIKCLADHRDELVQLAAGPFLGIEEATRIGRELKLAKGWA